MATDPPDVSRRQFVLGLGAGLIVGGGGVAAYQTLKPAAPASPASVTIDPNTIRRRGVGFRGSYHPRRASPGFTLFTPLTGPGMVYLIDIQGNVSHTWKMPYPPGVYGYLTDKGTLFYNGKIPNDTFIGKAPFMGGAAMEVDWNGKVLWEIKQPDHHHDGRLLRNGNVLLLVLHRASGRYRQTSERRLGRYRVRRGQDHRRLPGGEDHERQDRLGMARLGAYGAGRVPDHLTKRRSLEWNSMATG